MFCQVIYPDNYNNNKKYIYKTDIKDLKKGELLVVPSKDTFSIASFVDYCVPDSTLNIEYKHTIQKVDLTEHNNREENKKKKKRKEILSKLEKKKKEFEEMKMYLLMAETDAEAAELINELKELDK